MGRRSLVGPDRMSTLPVSYSGSCADTLFILDCIGAFTRSQGPRTFLLQRLIAQSRATRKVEPRCPGVSEAWKPCIVTASVAIVQCSVVGMYTVHLGLACYARPIHVTRADHPVSGYLQPIKMEWKMEQPASSP